ncbi:MAG: GNAT family N-acetyltransferase [Nitrospinota bacterium]
MKVDSLTDASAFSELERDWRDLLAESPPRSIFLTPQWQNLWWRHFSGGRNLRIVTVRSAEGKLLGLCSLTEAQGRYEFLGGEDLCDHLDVLSVPGHEETVANELLAEAGENFPGVREVDLHFVPEDSRILSPLREAAMGMRWDVSIEAEETSPFIPLPETWEAYLAGLRGKDRHELRRKMRRTEGAGSLRVRTSSPAEFREDLETFLRLHALSAPEKLQFMDAPMQEFFREAGERILSEGWLRLTLLEVDGDQAAALLTFDYDGAVLAYNSGYDKRFSAVSPGFTLFTYAIRAAIQEGRRAFDFLRGNETYKYRLGGQDRPLYHVNLRPIR